MAYIYKHTRNDTNEVFYIGIGSGNTGSEYCTEYIDKNSILNSYPLDNIK